MKGPTFPREGDTVAAISTPYGAGGIGIVRMSGPRAERVARSIFLPRHPRKSVPSHRLLYGHIRDPRDGSLVDEVLLAWMCAPHTYTREDMVEIQCHGGPVPVQRILEICLSQGARLAGPGEFTRRAFLNGRIDLLQAEAVADTVDARTATALRFAQRQLDGHLSREIRSSGLAVRSLLVEVEAWLDFPDEDLPEPDFFRIRDEVDRWVGRLRALAETYREGRLYRDGVTLVIGGLPNVGKSTLMNLLAGRNRAIVSPEPGTTRDFLEETLAWEGIPVRLIDTAGLRDAGDDVEAQGVAHARNQIRDADLFLFVLDASRLDEVDPVWVGQTVLKDRTLLVFNKMDLADEEAVDRVASEWPAVPSVRISALHGQGLDRFRETVVGRLTGESMGLDSRAVVTNLRHWQALETCAAALSRAREQMTDPGRLAGDLLAADLRLALRALGDLLGETTPGEILESIFERFCVGK